jgi:hypothetical protein
MGLCGNIFDPFLLSWNVGSLVTIFLPLLIFTIARLTNKEDWNYNDQQQEQDNNNNYNNNPYANPENYDEYGYYVGPTHWWQFWKKNNNGEGGGENELRTPWWCMFLLLLSCISRMIFSVV